MALEYGGSAAVALENGGGVGALEDGVGWRLKIAVAALGGGGSRRTCNGGVGISVLEAKGLLYNVGVSIGEYGKRGHLPCKGSTPAAMARR